VDSVPGQNALPTVLKSLELESFKYSIYMGVDDDDPFFLDLHTRAGFEGLVKASSNEVPLKWVPFHNTLHKPGPIFNNMSITAYLDGCDYMYRINDDTQIITSWTSAFVSTLRSLTPPNVGVVGPVCKQGNAMILTHDFVHRTHLEVFGYHYPPKLTDWWLDDWITLVYGRNSMRQRDVEVFHNALFTRYEVDMGNERVILPLVERTRGVLREWLSGRGLPEIGMEPVGKRRGRRRMVQKRQ
jgi:hypothetical protein